MANNDVQTEMKKRARRRLVGAAALAVLAAVVLPMVMDHEPRPASQDIQIRIPSPDAGAFTSRVMPGKPVESTPLPAPNEGPPGAAPKPAPVAAEAATARGAEAEKPAEPGRAAEPAKAAQSVKAAEPGKTGEAEKTAAKAPPADRSSAPAAASSPEPSPPAPAGDEAARARAILDDAGQFIVQLGVFADPANVTKVRARVKAEGYNSFVEILDGGGKPKTRVRAGPFASRADAERARERLQRAGLPGIVAPRS